MKGRHTLRLKELQLAVKELKMRLGEDDLRNVFFTGATADIARLGHIISRVDGTLGIGGVADGHLGRHGESVQCRKKYEKYGNG
jgi:hypothetical protein